MQANKEKQKKIVIIIVAAALVLILVAYVLTVVLEHVKSSIIETTSVPRVELIFPPADYDENILNDAIYMTFDRNIKFTQGGYGITLTEQDLKNYGTGAKLFFDYFICVINGRYEEYPDFFTDKYKNDVKLPEKFTMQKIYDIDVKLFSRVLENETTKTYRETYEVRYKIRNNNGTLRNDVESDTIKPIVFELIVDDKIADIDDIYPMITINVPGDPDE